jgi:hypothetical protein
MQWSALAQAYIKKFIAQCFFFLGGGGGEKRKITLPIRLFLRTTIISSLSAGTGHCSKVLQDIKFSLICFISFSNKQKKKKKSKAVPPHAMVAHGDMGGEEV